MATSEKPHIASDLLSRAHSPAIATSIFKDRIKQKPLLLRATSPDPSLNARAQRQKSGLQKAAAARKSKKPRPLSAKQKRAVGLYEIPKEQRKYRIYVPLHEMWCGYMREVLGGGLGHGQGQEAKALQYVTPASHGPLLASADYHGAKVEVVRSRCVGRVGIKGIVVRDTKFTFEVVTEADEVKVVPKEHTVFRVEVPCGGGDGAGPLVFEIHGGQFMNRAPDRANKKFRLHLDPDL
ncbi:hypothetical protein M8818_004059 [Zalaria obscura]|uniref:Uncharacterized protein n=1 Tax=Zalaria obscura TaxID=2024903 RepID=A0ACC3SCS7_9PEZI